MNANNPTKLSRKEAAKQSKAKQSKIDPIPFFWIIFMTRARWIWCLCFALIFTFTNNTNNSRILRFGVQYYWSWDNPIEITKIKDFLPSFVCWISGHLSKTFWIACQILKTNNLNKANQGRRRTKVTASKQASKYSKGFCVAIEFRSLVLPLFLFLIISNIFLSFFLKWKTRFEMTIFYFHCSQHQET